MNRDLRTPGRAHLFDGSAGLCRLAFQGDFGRGVATGSGVFSEPGVNVFTLYGPLAAGANTVMVGAIPQVPMRLGTVISGTEETEWILCRYVASSAPDLKPGLMWFIDENYTATLTTSAGRTNMLGAQIGVSYVFQTAPANGTYFIWLARAGRVLAKDNGSSLAQGFAETTSTAGAAKFVASHTATTADATPFTAWAASSNITFKANMVSGSPYLTNVQSQISINGVTGGITDLIPGMTITSSGGLPANALIAAIDQQGGLWRVTLGTDSSGAFFTLQNATANNTAMTFTVTSHVQALMYWPTITNVT